MKIECSIKDMLIGYFMTITLNCGVIFLSFGNSVSNISNPEQFKLKFVKLTFRLKINLIWDLRNRTQF